MATSQKIRIMLSSRCLVDFSEGESVELTEIRRALKKDIEKQKLFKLEPFEVWINEDAEALDQSADSW